MFNLNPVLYGDPAGREMWFYEPEPGSNVLANVYCDEACTIPHSIPVVADASGNFPPIFVDQSKRIEARLKDRHGTLLYSHSDARQLCGPQIRCHECGALMRRDPIT